MNELKKRILDISYKLKLSHIGSCLTALPIIEEIYKIKKPDEKFTLSEGHAHLAHAVIMEKYGIIKDAEENIIKHGIHCERAGGCDVSTGSLGQGLPIACGMALANRSKNVYCLISDGECAEGSVWEALRIIRDESIVNLKLYVNINGWGAYHRIYRQGLVKMLKAFQKTSPKTFLYIKQTDFKDFPFLKGLGGHYHTLTEKEYQNAKAR